MTGFRGYLFDRLGLALAGLMGIALLAVLAGFAQAGPIGPPAGPLDPPAGSPPSPTDGVRLPGTPISSAPFVIDNPGHYYLTRNLTVAGATAIQVNVADVSIDLGGFTLAGNDTASAHGIDGGGDARLSISNGTIVDFDRGIIATAGEAMVRGVTLVSNNVGMAIGPGAVVSGCLVSQNVDGIIMTGAFAEVRDCNVNANGARGILMNDSIETGLIERTSLFFNNASFSPFFQGVSMRAGKRTLRDSVLSANNGPDVSVTGYDHIIIDNVISCPTSLVLSNTANVYAPVNVADPHTNRAQKAAC